MKKALVLSSAALLWATMAFAQDASSASAGSQSGNQTLQGCLSKSGDSFNLSANGQSYRVVGGDLSQLQGKDGHQVSISGSVSGSEINLQSASDIASTCSSNTAADNTNSSSGATASSSDTGATSAAPSGSVNNPSAP